MIRQNCRRGSIRRQSEQERHYRDASQDGADSMQPVPFHDQITGRRSRVFRLRRLEQPVGRHDAENGPWPIGEHQHRTDEERDTTCEPPSRDSEEERDNCKWSLHRESALIGWFPLSEKCTVIQPQACRLFGEVDIERGTGKEGRNYQGEVASEHRYWSADLFVFPRR